jgi:AcrR family transcriptional regulator
MIGDFMADKLIKDRDQELRRLIFSEIYLRYSEPKTLRRAQVIMEAAIQCIGKRGIRQVTIQMVAREAGVTRPLIKYYFADLNELLQLSIRYIRLLFQKLAIGAMTKSKRPDEMLAHYVDSCFFWVENFKIHSRAWLDFLHLCMHSKSARETNTQAVQTGEGRIAALLEKGRDEGVFQFSDAALAAKLVQTIITGGLMTYVSENLDHPEAYAREIRESCLRILNCPGH